MLKIDAVSAFLNGFSKVMLQENRITGLLFLIGIAINSIQFLVFAILGLLAGTAFAVLAGYDRKHINNGTYGYNGVLVGIACLFFIADMPVAALLAIVLGALSSLITKLWPENRLPALTAPFCIMGLIAYSLALFFGLTDPGSTSISQASQLDLVGILFKGVSQVMLQNNIFTGIFFSLGLAASAMSVAAYALLGSAIGPLVAIPFIATGTINAGIYGFNGALCGIALGGVRDKNLVRKGIMVVGAVVLSAVLTYLFIQGSIPPLTTPFVISTWVFLLLQGKMQETRK